MQNNEYINELANNVLCLVLSDIKKGYIDNAQYTVLDSLKKHINSQTEYYEDNIKIAKNADLDDLGRDVWEKSYDFKHLAKNIAQIEISKVCNYLISEDENYKKIRNAKKEQNKSKIEQYTDGLIEHLGFQKVIDLEDIPEEDPFNISDILEELDKRGIEYERGHYINEYGKVKSISSTALYCEEFYEED